MKSNSKQAQQNEKKKEALNEYLDALKEVGYWSSKVEAMGKSNRYRSPAAPAAPVGGGIADPTEATVMELEATREQERRARKFAQEAKDRVLALIRMAPTADQRVLLMRHYIDGMSWEEAAEAAGKSRTWATNNHGTALLHITIPNETE